MSSKIYAIVGNWHYIPGPRGLTIFRYDENDASMELVETVLPDLEAGNTLVDEKRRIIYVVNECGDKRGQLGGGGYILALKISPETGKTTLINEIESLSSTPSYLCMDKSGMYGMAVHHAGFGCVTKIRKNLDGSYYSEALKDDAAVILFRIMPDGSLGEICDVSIHSGTQSKGIHAFSHLHSIVSDPTGELFLVCDKGCDKIYSYKLDRENEKLLFINETSVNDNYCPRYGAFHPVLPFYYSDNEKSDRILCFQYNLKDGSLILKDSVSMLTCENSNISVEPSDLIIHPGGQTMYVSGREANIIAVFHIDNEGKLHLIQNISSEGSNPRGLCITPDLRYLAVTNSDSPNIAFFKIEPDGRLNFHRNDACAPCPANIKFMVVE